MLILAAQTLDDVISQFVAGIQHGYGVAVDNRFQYFPIMWMAAGGRSIENTIIEARVHTRLSLPGDRQADPLFPTLRGDLEESPA